MPFRPRMACCVHFSWWLYCRGQHFLGPESSDIFWVKSWWPWRSSAFPVQDQQSSYFLGKYSITITWLMCFTTIDGKPIFNQFFFNHLVVKISLVYHLFNVYHQSSRFFPWLVFFPSPPGVGSSQGRRCQRTAGVEEMGGDRFGGAWRRCRSWKKEEI